ncbi:helix-turn-helix domain-containing protein [Bradyrhizobium vignae]|uniref:helix-turn-helix domain-containing protein n=1 Tax=Bradyrhizobium vignae TaxID=1549949 RepID=UPI00100ACC46|nr:helix-turn-helix domain-containing protein [Bradyrhizobium vignae]RXH06725.1 DNA-binding protein [Bradyrhizobium vignae]
MKLAYSIQEACSLLSIGRTTIYALIGQGDLAILKIGRRTLISAKSLDAFIQSIERNSGRDSLGENRG